MIKNEWWIIRSLLTDKLVVRCSNLHQKWFTWFQNCSVRFKRLNCNLINDFGVKFICKMKLTIKITSYFELIKHPIRLPPPVMFYLSEFCFSIVTVNIRPISIKAFHHYCPTVISHVFRNLNQHTYLTSI